MWLPRFACPSDIVRGPLFLSPYFLPRVGVWVERKCRSTSDLCESDCWNFDPTSYSDSTRRGLQSNVSILRVFDSIVELVEDLHVIMTLLEERQVVRPSS